MTELEKAREEINEIDRQIAALFEKRMHAAAAIGAFKAEHHLPILDPAREEALIRRNSALIEDEQLVPYYQEYLRRTMELSRRYQAELNEGRKA